MQSKHKQTKCEHSRRNSVLSSKKSNLIPLLVSVISQYSQSFSCRFPEIFTEKMTFKEYEEICENIHKD